MKTTILFVALCTLVACGAANSPPPGTAVVSTKQRVTTAAPAADVEQTVASNLDFAFGVYRELIKANDNLAFSPYSVTTALALTYPGARGDTQLAFETTLQVKLPQAQWHRAMNTIDRELASRGQSASGVDGNPFALRSNNQLFAQKGFTMLPEYLDVLATEYGAGVRLMDFQTSPEPSRQQINQWISGTTDGLIPELLAKGTIGSDTVLTLVNTLYFNAAWKTKFRHEATAPADFTLLDGSKKQVPTMVGQDLTGGHALVDGVDVIDLPYSGDEVSLLVLMPAAGEFSAFEQSLTATTLNTLAQAPQQGTLALKLPKFDVRTAAPLTDLLKKLGLEKAFSGDADFSGLSAEGGLAITSVIHEAVVKTDEDGTVAAAATAVVVRTVSAPTFVEVNRPFVYAIRDRASGAVLFLGRVVSP